MEDIKQALEKAVEDVRRTGPMAPSITNFVTIDFVANAQIAAGGSAAMIYMPDEGRAMAEMAPAIYINVGTILPVYEQTVPEMAKTAYEHGGYVLDPVAVGVGDLRTKLLEGMKSYPPRLIRGNASEVISVAKMWGLVSSDKGTVRGVDSTDTVVSARESAEAIARFIGGAVCVSGRDDLVTDGERTILSHGGSEYFARITGSGCSLGGVCAVYLAVADPFTAALAATNAYNVAGKRAEEEAEGTASFKVAFLDALSNLGPSDVSGCSMEVI
ncbi:MAG: hydroxyethylthiazole kinase [Peptoniphilus sp.]|nr:hydroxyethylthiazole kinase [Peptoniphilus sp.]MDD7363042.1 hydroxyethylthiazole kinase [Bacillota bacterium]MDY6045307.1 hydroxyethylthiazole kinase [Peptoniphilus sp.]